MQQRGEDAQELLDIVASTAKAWRLLDSAVVRNVLGDGRSWYEQHRSSPAMSGTAAA